MSEGSPPTPTPCRLVVWPDQDGLRLDLFLAAATGLSRRQARALIDGGSAARNGEVLRVQSRQVEVGDVVDVLGVVSDLSPTRPDLPPVAILHEDRWLLVADKPTGVLSQPVAGTGRRELALDQRLLLVLARRDGKKPFVRLVHRLDRLTSGVLLFALHPASLAPLTAAWRQGLVERVYHAVVEAHPTADHYDVARPIGRDPGHAWRFRVDPRGRTARTEVKVLWRGEWGERLLALVECRLSSGRTHQVRVHLAATGHPVLGDRLYGSRGGADRPLLHASRLTLPHLRGGGRLRVSSPLPDDFAGLLPVEVVTLVDPG